MSLRIYTRFVLFGKHALWVMAALLLVILVWVANYNTGENGKRLVFTNMQQNEILQNIMGNPHYQGLDDNNQPYTVVADKATQIDDKHVSLDNIKAEITRHDGKWLALNALSGIYDSEQKKLELKGGVEIFTGDGHQMRTDHAYIDIDKGSAYGDAAVEGQGPLGTLKAKQFSLKERGQVIQCKGDVKVRVYRD